MNHNVSYIRSSLIIEALAKDNIKIAQDSNIVGSVASSIREYVLDHFDKNRPISSIAAFLGPGLLWRMGFPWISVLYEVADALGFDWKGFWSSVGSAMTEFVKTILDLKRKPSEAELSSKVNEAVSEAFQNNFSGEPNKNKLLNIATKSFQNDVNDALELKAIANDPLLIKQASVLSIFKTKLARFFINIISWIVRTSFVSLGLVAGAGAIKGLLGLKHKDDGETDQVPQEDEDHHTPSFKLKISPTASQELFDIHPNNMSNIWIEHGSIDNIDNIILSWVFNMYPQLKQYTNEIKNSNTFQSIINVFMSRNHMASGLDVISIPRPYQRKSDIVDIIVNGFLQEYAHNLE